jgi:hypothetical protein
MCYDNVKTGLNKVNSEGVDRIKLAESRIQWRIFVDMPKEIYVPPCTSRIKVQITTTKVRVWLSTPYSLLQLQHVSAILDRRHG